ncbi:hypothetical protein B9Z55_008535 [Caenorhabditis nigoni]|uniref:Uncharacterized protein n=1 Tax=Caenorhabditis nigoni TaxID=1611254 RepID=A0A2G5UNM9_9PELO|nr:hypothetical protein B9Z55_008535 [Caenorhabditis nigoni]
MSFIHLPSIDLLLKNISSVTDGQVSIKKIAEGEIVLSCVLKSEDSRIREIDVGYVGQVIALAASRTMGVDPGSPVHRISTAFSEPLANEEILFVGTCEKNGFSGSSLRYEATAVRDGRIIGAGSVVPVAQAVAPTTVAARAPALVPAPVPGPTAAAAPSPPPALSPVPAPSPAPAPVAVTEPEAKRARLDESGPPPPPSTTSSAVGFGRFFPPDNKKDPCQKYMMVNVESDSPLTETVLAEELEKFGLLPKNVSHTRTFIKAERRNHYIVYFDVDGDDRAMEEHLNEKAPLWMNSWNLENVKCRVPFFSRSISVYKQLKAVVVATRNQRSQPHLEMFQAISDGKIVLESIKWADAEHGMSHYMSSCLTKEGKKIFKTMRKNVFQ